MYVSWLTIVEGDQNTHFSIATTPRYKKGCYSFPLIAPLTLDNYLVMVSVNQGEIKYHFYESLVCLDLVLILGLQDHWQTF